VKKHLSNVVNFGNIGKGRDKLCRKGNLHCVLSSVSETRPNLCSVRAERTKHFIKKETSEHVNIRLQVPLSVCMISPRAQNFVNP
jgi:hypothetical protein